MYYYTKLGKEIHEYKKRCGCLPRKIILNKISYWAIIAELRITNEELHKLKTLFGIPFKVRKLDDCTPWLLGE